MKKALLLATMILGLSSVSVYAEGSYVGANIGLAVYHGSKTTETDETSTLKYDMGSGVDIALGYAFNRNFSVEAEFSYRSADWDKMNGISIPARYGVPDLAVGTDVMSYMVNGYYNITQLAYAVTPFVGAGVGMINAEVSYSVPGFIESKDDTVFGYQVMLGGSYPINRKVNINAGYKYQMTASDLKGSLKGNTIEFPYKSSTFLFGARYNF
jgi:opacity protein-like surface antigen